MPVKLILVMNGIQMMIAQVKKKQEKLQPLLSRSVLPHQSSSQT
jgi:hypothetical protein